MPANLPGIIRTPSLWSPGQAPLGVRAVFDQTHPQSRGLLGWWSSALGDFASDITGQRARLTLTGPHTNDVSRLGPTKTLSGSGYWSGSDVGLPSGDNSRTISCWASTSSVAGQPVLWVYGRSGGDDALFLYLSSATFLDLSTSTHALTNDSTTTWSDGRLHHYIVSYATGGVTKVLIDGRDYTSYGGSSNGWTLSTVTGATGLFIGAYIGGGSNQWSGQVENFKIWNRALSTQEMLTEFYEPFGALRSVRRHRFAATGALPPSGRKPFIFFIR